MLGKLLTPGVSSSMKIKIFKAIENKINDSEDAIRSESLDLTDVIRKIDGPLYRSKKFFENRGQDNLNLNILKGEFQTLRQEYVKLMWQSREELGRVESVLRDYTSSLSEFLSVSEAKVSPRAKSDAIERYVKRIVATQGNLHSHAWNKFLVDLKAFDQKFTSNGLGNNTVGPEVEELTRKIANLSAQLQSSSDLLNQAVSSGADTGEVVQGLIILHSLAPLATGGVLATATKAADGQEDPQISQVLAKKIDLTHQIAELDKQLEKKIQELDDAAKVKVDLDRSVMLAESITDRMHNLLGSVVGMLAADLQNLAKASFGAVITQDGTTEARIELMAAAYKSVSKGLGIYGETAVPPNPL